MLAKIPTEILLILHHFHLGMTTLNYIKTPSVGGGHMVHSTIFVNRFLLLHLTTNKLFDFTQQSIQGHIVDKIVVIVVFYCKLSTHFTFFGSFPRKWQSVNLLYPLWEYDGHHMQHHLGFCFQSVPLGVSIF